MLKKTLLVFQHFYKHALNFHDDVFLELIRPEKCENVRKKRQKYNEVISKRNKMLRGASRYFLLYFLWQIFVAISFSFHDEFLFQHLHQDICCTNVSYVIAEIFNAIACTDICNCKRWCYHTCAELL